MIYKNFPQQCKCLFFSLSIIFLLSCSDDNEETPSLELSSYTVNQLYKVNSMATVSQELWPEYDYLSTAPIYYILEENGETHGYIINPPSPLPSGSIPVKAHAEQTLEIVQNDNLLSSAFRALGETRRFEFYYFHEGIEYFLLVNRSNGSFYDSFKNFDNNWGLLALTHEVFHKYQFDRWTFSDERMSDLENYPFSNEILAWHLFYYDLMADAHRVKTNTEAITILKQYVAVMSHMQALDFSENDLVRRTGTYGELVEGTARYIEVFSAEQEVYPLVNEDPTHGWRWFLEGASTEQEVKLAIAVRLWYHSGAAATHLLRLIDAPLYTAFPQSITPFEVARDELQLSDQEINDIISEMRSRNSWIDYEQQAAAYLQLFD